MAKIQDFFAYGELKNCIGEGAVHWKKAYFYNGYRDIPAQEVPAHIQWSNNPIFHYVGIVNNAVEYRYSEKGDSAYYIFPITTNKKHIARINDAFHDFYHRHGLREALNVSKKQLPKIDRTNPLELIKNYLTTGADEDFESLMAENDIAFWVDWREYDVSIIEYCEAIIQTQQLSAMLNDTNDEMGFELLINYKGAQHKVPYLGKGADRDTTIITLNKVLMPSFEIRLLIPSKGSDTLAFMPLSKAQWQTLATQFGQAKLAEYFEKITENTVLFG